MEAGTTPPANERPANDQNDAPRDEGANVGGDGGPAEPAQVGDQGPQVTYEQDAGNVGVVEGPDGETAFRQSAPPAAAQSGVPIEADRQAGVKPGEQPEEEPAPADAGSAAQ